MRQGLTGLVLCGGYSRRMGRDKGSLLIGGRPGALVMGSKLADLHIPVLYSIRQEQHPVYTSFIPAEQLVTDSLELGGPLNGLLSVHRQLPGADLLLIACDMFDTTAATLETLVAAYRANDFSFYAYLLEGILQPFPAIYTASGLSALPGPLPIRDAFSAAANILPRGLRACLELGPTRVLTAEDPASFNNYNGPE